MHALAARLKAVSDAVNRGAVVACVGCFAVMLATVTLQVVARYLFASPPFWTEELARWAMVWGGLLGITVAFHESADPKLYQPPLARSAVRAIQGAARLVGAWVFMGTVFYFSIPFIHRQSQQLSEGLGISPMWVSLAVPVAATLVCFHALVLAIAQPFLPPEPVHDPQSDLH